MENNENIFNICRETNLYTIIFELRKYLKKINELKEENLTYIDISILSSEIKSFIFSVPFLKNNFLKKVIKITEITETTANNKNNVFFDDLKKRTNNFASIRKDITAQEKEFIEFYKAFTCPRIFMFLNLIPIMGEVDCPITAKNRFEIGKDIISFYMINLHIYFYKKNISNTKKLKKYYSIMYSHCINNPLYKDLQYIDFLVLMTDEAKNIIKEYPITEKFYITWLLSAIQGTIFKLIEIVSAYSSLLLYEDKEKITDEQLEQKVCKKYTKRELDIINRLDFTNKEIAKELNISQSTVQTYIEQIAQKTGIQGGKKMLKRVL